MGRDDVARRFDARAVTYDDGSMHRWLASEVARFLGPRPLGDILDVATGTGLALRALVHRPDITSMTGTDVSDGMLDVARRELPAALFVRGDAEDLPFAGDSFDTVLCVSALPYFSARTFMAEASRVLRPGGAVLLTAFAEDGITVPRLLRSAAREFGVLLVDPNAETGTIDRVEKLAFVVGLVVSRSAAVESDAPLPDPGTAIGAMLESGFADDLASSPVSTQELVRYRFSELVCSENADTTLSLIIELQRGRNASVQCHSRAEKREADPMHFDALAEVYDRARPPYPPALWIRLHNLGLLRNRSLADAADAGRAARDLGGRVTEHYVTQLIVLECSSRTTALRQ